MIRPWTTLQFANRIGSRASLFVRKGAASTFRSPTSYHVPVTVVTQHFYRPFSSTEPPKQQQQQQTTSNASISDDIDTDDDGNDTQPTTLQGRIFKSILTPQNQLYATIAGGGVATYILSRVVLSFTGFFTHLTPTVVAKWSFYTGFGTATVLGGVVLVALDNITIRADPVYKYCLNWVINDSNVQSALGDGLTPGHLRSYRIDAGRLGLPTASCSSSLPQWRPPRIQMLFDITANGPPYRTGLVTIEAIKSGGFPARIHTTLLKVDYETGTEGDSDEGDQTLFLRGSEQQLERVSRRSGMSLEKLARAVHINQASSKQKQ